MATNENNMEGNEVLHMCLVMLKDECEAADHDAALQTLLKILRNIRENPTVEKFRTIRKENKSFHGKIWRWDSAQQFLYAVGWIDADDSIILTEDNNLAPAITLLEQTLSERSPSTTVNNSQIVGGSPQNRELSEKEKRIAEERKKLMETLKRDKEERQKLKEQIKADRRDVSTRESKDSKARDMKSGGTMTKFKDIGVDLSKGGG